MREKAFFDKNVGEREKSFRRHPKFFKREINSFVHGGKKLCDFQHFLNDSKNL